MQEEAEKQVLQLGRQLIGNLDEVTDLRLIGPPNAPTQLVLATNSPTIRMFNLETMSCSATLTGHTDTVLVLDALHTKGEASARTRPVVTPFAVIQSRLSVLVVCWSSC